MFEGIVSDNVTAHGGTACSQLSTMCFPLSKSSNGVQDQRHSIKHCISQDV
jgi:hypothetical protein